MTNQGIISESFRGLLAQACLSALLLIAGVYAAKKFVAMLRSFLSRLWKTSRMGLAAVALLSLAMGPPALEVAEQTKAGGELLGHAP